MSYTYCSNCADAVCTCGEKYKGMSAVDLTALIAVLTEIRDRRVVMDTTVEDPEVARQWRIAQQRLNREKHPLPRRS